MCVALLRLTAYHARVLMLRVLMCITPVKLWTKKGGACLMRLPAVYSGLSRFDHLPSVAVVAVVALWTNVAVPDADRR